LVHEPELGFFKKFVETFRVPEKKVEPEIEEEELPPLEPMNAEPAAPSEPEEPEEPEEVDPELLKPDQDPPLPSGDSSNEPSEEAQMEASSLKAQGLDAHREGNYERALELLTAALQKNPRSGILYASRAQILLDHKKPNAAIRDCDKALSINPDSAKPYKIRGRARRFLGKYEEGLKDIQQGQKLDWDDGTHAFEAELKKKVEKIVERRKKQEAKKKAQPKPKPAEEPEDFPGMGGFG